MIIPKNVKTVRGYAIYLGLDPSNRSVLRKIQRQCERGELNAELDHGTWLIEIPQKNEGVLVMKNWESVKEVYFQGMTLNHAGGSSNVNAGLENPKISLFYVNQVPLDKVSNHFEVTWDLREFFASVAAGTFQWPSPHAISRAEGTSLAPYGQKMEFNGQKLTLVNRPVEFAPSAGKLRFYALAIDEEKNKYRVYWNIFNMFEPSEIVMTVDNSRYCKHCLTSWTRNADTSKCEHEWINVSD